MSESKKFNVKVHGSTGVKEITADSFCTYADRLLVFTDKNYPVAAYPLSEVVSVETDGVKEMTDA